MVNWSQMKSKKDSRSIPPSAGAVAPPPPTREQIQALAHAIWTDRGCPEGCDVEIWFEAERQLGGAGTTSSHHLAPEGESVDRDRSDAARVDQELERIVSNPAPRSPTSL